MIKEGMQITTMEETNDDDGGMTKIAKGIVNE